MLTAPTAINIDKMANHLVVDNLNTIFFINRFKFKFEKPSIPDFGRLVRRTESNKTRYKIDKSAPNTMADDQIRYLIN